MILDGGITVLGISIGDYSGEALSAVFVILIFLGVWRPGSEVKKWQRAAERSADQVDRLTDTLEDLVEAIKHPKVDTGETPQKEQR